MTKILRRTSYMLAVTLSSAFLVLSTPSILCAQQDYKEQLGPPQAGAVAQVEMGSINLSNGNLHLEVPLGNFAQRGSLGLSAKLAYDSRIWIPYAAFPAMLPSYRPANLLHQGLPTMGGWRLVVSTDPGSQSSSGFDYVADWATCPDTNPPGSQQWAIFSNFTWTDPDGVVRVFGNPSNVAPAPGDPPQPQNSMYTALIDPPGQPNCSIYGDVPNASGYATDGSGYYMVVTNHTDVKVYDKNGNQFVPGFSVKDTNGNYSSRDPYFSTSPTLYVVDTLGRVPVITTTSGNNVYYDVLNSLGSRSRYTITTTGIPVSVPNYSSTITVVQSITLPNNTTYTFGYDSGTSGDNWGLITSVTLPTGGQISYGYQNFTDACGQGQAANWGVRWVNSRTSGGGTWHYTPLVTAFDTSLSAGAETVTVAKPSGDYIVYKLQAFCGANGADSFRNTETDSYAANGALLRQELIDYAVDYTSPPPAPQLGISVPKVARVTTVIPSAGGELRSKSEYDYTNSPSVGNPTTISDWNFFTGTAPASPDRVRRVTYSLTGNSTLAAAHIIGKTLTVTLTDGASTPTQIAQTTYSYDDYNGNPLSSTGLCQTTSASQPSPAAPQHDYQGYCTSNTVRGNLTQVSEWLNMTGSSITTATNTYDDTGNVVKIKDALSNSATIEFSPSFGLAYPTKITNPLGHISTKAYDFNTGLVVSETDPNGQTTGLKTTHSYDGMGRLIEADFPDGGQVKVNFNGDAIPLTITTTQLATPDPSIAKTTVLDGLGRTQTECLTDPEGNACVDTAYDLNGRVRSKSNPHRTTAAASDGTTSFSYDGLDRANSVTEPDGNVVSTSYDTQSTPVLGQTVTATDETGRQRHSVADGFGRLVEVDEPGNGFAGTQASGGLTISGILQNKPATNSTPGTASVTLSGSEQSKSGVGATLATAGTGSVTISGGEQVTSQIDPNCIPDPNPCGTIYIYDGGTVSIAINGTIYSSNFGPNDTSNTIASALANAINAGSLATATASGATVSIRSRITGSGSNYALSTGYTFDSADFGSPSFTASASGNTLTGGTNANPGTTVYDHGVCTVTVNGTPYSENFGQGDTTTSIASGLGTVITGGSLASATASGATLSLTAKTGGASTNYSLTSTCSYDSANFSGPSFTAGTSGSSLTGGANGSPAATDAGTVTITIGSFVASTSYGASPGNSTTAQVASALVGGLNQSGSPVTAVASGSTISLTYSTVGAAGNVAVSCSSSTSQSAYFSSPSFTCPGTTLSGGQDPYSSGLAHAYVSRYFYDLLDNLTCIEQHGNTTGSGCSPAVLSPSSTPPAADATSPWRVRRFAYDSLSRLVWANDPESGLSSNAYDNNGNLISQTDARGVTINYNPSASPIDALNRVTMTTYSDGTPSVAYKYDASCCGVTSLNAVGRLTSANAGTTSLTFSYDPMGRTVTHWDCPPSGTARGSCYVISALYDLAGQMTSLTYPDGRTVTTSYSGAGRMIGVTLASYGATGVNIPYYTVPQNTSPTTWGYWPSGAMNRGMFGNGVTETSSYGNRMQMNSIADVRGSQTLLNKIYGLYDASSHNNGNILSIVDGLNSATNQSYNYDALNRILSGAQADNTFNITFSYDPWGNMQQSGTSSFQPVYDVHNHIQSSSYDAAGDLLNDGFHAYTYDAPGRMKTVDGTAATYTYNPLGNRVRKDTTSGSTEYFFFGEDLIAELNPATNAWTDYVFGYGERIAKDTSTNGTGAQYFHSDQIDSTRLVTDSSGAVIWQATYGPFGQELSAQNNAISFQFAGMQYDSETALNHTDYRQYSSSEGRWLTPDPYLGSLNPANPQSFNRYVYVLDNPLKFRDPKGLDCIYDADPSANLRGGPLVIPGDCLDDNDNGFFVDGTVSNVHYQPNGDIYYDYYRNKDDRGSGVIGLAPYDPVAAVGELTRQEWEKRRAEAKAKLLDNPLNPFADGVFKEVGRQTGYFTKQINCTAGFAYPLLPGIKPEDVEDMLTDVGADYGSDGLESKSETMEDKAKKLARAKKKGSAQAARVAKKESKALKFGSKLVKGANFALNAKDGYNNWADCQAGKDPQ